MHGCRRAACPGCNAAVTAAERTSGSIGSDSGHDLGQQSYLFFLRITNEQTCDAVTSAGRIMQLMEWLYQSGLGLAKYIEQQCDLH